MSFLLDIIIIAIIAVTIYFAAKNGFVKTVISAVSFILAVAVTAMFASPFADYLRETTVAETVETAVTETVEEILLENSMELSDLLNGASEEFNTLLNIADIDRNELLKAESIENVAKLIADPITDIVAMVAAVIIIFILAQIVLAIAAFFLNKLANLPILRTANKGLGIGLGAVLALFRVFLFCFAMTALIEHADFLGSDFLLGLNPDSTFLFKFFSQIDVFAFFI